MINERDPAECWRHLALGTAERGEDRGSPRPRGARPAHRVPAGVQPLDQAVIGDHDVQDGDTVEVAAVAPVNSPAGGSPIGVLTVPAWRPGMDASVLPLAYRDVLEVLIDAGKPLRAGHLAAALGLGEGAGTVEGCGRS